MIFNKGGENPPSLTAPSPLFGEVSIDVLLESIVLIDVGFVGVEEVGRGDENLVCPSEEFIQCFLREHPLVFGPLIHCPVELAAEFCPDGFFTHLKLFLGDCTLGKFCLQLPENFGFVDAPFVDSGVEG